MSYPTLRPEYWANQAQEQRAQEVRIGRTGGADRPAYCSGPRVRWWGLMLFSVWLTYKLRTLDIDGQTLILLLVVGTPITVLVLGWVLKLWCTLPASIVPVLDLVSHEYAQ